MGGYLVECRSSLDVKRRTGAVDCGGKRNRAGRRETLHEARFTNREALGIYLGWSERHCAGRLCRILLQCGGVWSTP